MSESEGQDWHWRNSMKPVRFFSFDARAAAFILLVLLHFKTWTIALMVLVLFAFWAFERRGLTFAAALRAFRVWILGKKRPALVYTSRGKLRDTGSE